jgi:hypothetical protein
LVPKKRQIKETKRDKMSLHIDTGRESGKRRIAKEDSEGNIIEQITGLDDIDLDGIRSMINETIGYDYEGGD